MLYIQYDMVIDNFLYNSGFTSARFWNSFFFRCIREDNDDNKAPIGIFLLVLLVSFFPIVNLLLMGYCINLLIEDEDCREDYGRLSMLGQLFSTRI